MWLFENAAPVSYLLDTEKGYQTVCPWCASNLGDRFYFKGTFGELYEKLYDMTRNHINSCKNKDKTDPVSDLEVTV